MAECPHCEYNKQRAHNWRTEAYKLSGHPLPRKETMTEDDDDIQDYKKPWVGLTAEERNALLHLTITHSAIDYAKAIEQALKEKNA